MIIIYSDIFRWIYYWSVLVVEENDGNKELGQRTRINKQMTPAYYQLLILLKRGYIKLKRDKVRTIKDCTNFIYNFYCNTSLKISKYKNRKEQIFL